jgi:hypothetical protein
MAKVVAKISPNMENLVVSAPGVSDLIIPISYRPKSETGLSVCGDMYEILFDKSSRPRFYL